MNENNTKKIEKKLKKLLEHLYKLEYQMDKCPQKDISKFQSLYFKTYIQICELENSLNINIPTRQK